MLGSRTTILSVLVPLAVWGCSAAPVGSSSLSADLPFPLAVGTSWEYSSERYELFVGQQSRALYSVVDTVVQSSQLSRYLVFQIDRSENLTSSEGGWNAPPASASTYWYLVRGTKLYQVFALDQISEPSAVHLMYPFPLQDGSSWCPTEGFPPDKCVASGLRTVTWIGGYETPAGSFEGCYLIADDFTTGLSSEVFCPQAGIVHQRYDHSGAPFGFANTLVSLQTPQEQ